MKTFKYVTVCFVSGEKICILSMSRCHHPRPTAADLFPPTSHDNKNINIVHDAAAAADSELVSAQIHVSGCQCFSSFTSSDSSSNWSCYRSNSVVRVTAVTRSIWHNFPLTFWKQVCFLCRKGSVARLSVAFLQWMEGGTLSTASAQRDSGTHHLHESCPKRLSLLPIEQTGALSLCS